MHLDQANALLKLFVIDLKAQAQFRFRQLASAGFGIKKRGLRSQTPQLSFEKNLCP